MKKERVRTIGEGKTVAGPVVYWMSRDQRVRDNWALLYAQQLALQSRAPLVVVFCLVPSFLHATMRHYGFMLKGLQEVTVDCSKKNISFVLLTGQPGTKIPAFLKEIRASALITDFNPLRIKQAWTTAVSKKITIPFLEVDTHNIVPCWIASPKQEYAAYTFRPKMKKLLSQYLEAFPALKKHPFLLKMKGITTDWKQVTASLRVNRTISEVSWLKPGEKAARRMLRTFIRQKLLRYDSARNNPVLEGQSDLSPYLHFGNISAQRVALEVKKSGVSKDREAFLEELIVRRELSDNFCFYNNDYDRFEGFPSWAQQSLNKHRKDRREYSYTLQEFEQGMTHDDLWNAAQMEMVKGGKMHGYMRMYWAKKILEWSTSPEKAMETAIYLNDTYELDGRDPNGYVGIAWSIGGVHDRAWNERRIFGKVRYMSYNGCKGKFDINKYIEKVKRLDSDSEASNISSPLREEK